jgi:hypothetical protein
MPNLNIQETRDLLEQFNFRLLFTEALGWSHARGQKPVFWQKNGAEGQRVMIAQLAGVAVFEVTADDGTIPNATICRSLANEISQLQYENLLIFVDAARTQSL